jgi:hypothetical protein
MKYCKQRFINSLTLLIKKFYPDHCNKPQKMAQKLYRVFQDMLNESDCPTCSESEYDSEIDFNLNDESGSDDSDSENQLK